MFNDIVKSAKLLGGCELLDNVNSIEDLLNLIDTPQGVEFIAKNNFPPIHLAQAYKDHLLKKGVVIEDTKLINPKRTIVLFGNIEIELDDYNVCEVYVTGSAVVNIIAKDNSCAFVEVHQQGRVIESGNVKVFKK